MARGEKRGPDDIESSTSKHRRAAPPPPAERHRRRPPTRSLDTRYKYLYPLIVVESALAPVASEPTWFVAVVLPLIVPLIVVVLTPLASELKWIVAVLKPLIGVVLEPMSELKWIMAVV
ncbi:hypothetical protein PF002_g31596 [Phytophthora fragariae]|uniref:Uncharacterized protein n=1 Tax=Phytophthora fragariae TaxID=53985 RepID=A0A6A3VED7_9STRA|nr:hypothetical protein PF002_g31596 [Phytophthora fragariae]